MNFIGMVALFENRTLPRHLQEAADLISSFWIYPSKSNFSDGQISKAFYKTNSAFKDEACAEHLEVFGFFWFFFFEKQSQNLPFG